MYLYIELYSEIVLSPVSNKCFVKLNLGFTDIGVACFCRGTLRSIVQSFLFGQLAI